MSAARREALRTKREWTVSDFALWLGISHYQARERLRRLNEETGGMLLRPSRGPNRRFTFLAVALRQAKPELFEEVDCLERRVETLEEKTADLELAQRRIIATVAMHSKELSVVVSSRRQ